MLAPPRRARATAHSHAEGNVFETLLETWKLDVSHNWFIVDYNRQSLDKIMEEQSSKVIDRMFRLNGFEARARARARSIFLPRLTCRA